MVQKTGWIYSLNCPETGNPKYIGLTVRCLKERLRNHLHARQNNKRNCWIKSIKAMGLSPVMEVIDIVPIEQIAFWEEHYISLYRSWGFELKNGTHGGEYGGKPNKETREKQRQAKLGTKQSEETKKKRAASLIGNKNGLGYKKTPEEIEKTRVALLGRKHTDESKLKMSLATKGKPKSAAHKLSLRKAKNK